ncbi:hypothetical protein [Clostridium sp.]|uniref:hypothetical protein n=1 Tax=Clostridium sp. TaxID=1506 RepID=UPI001EC2CF4A|nr:hypothetical protein [Clostridium sp.]MBS5886198.1 hypothetical protein [Clostridium sp.]
MVYLAIDTNIFISILLDDKEYDYSISNKVYGEIVDEEQKHKYEYEYEYERVSRSKIPKSLVNLKRLCENNIIQLLVPEVILLELKKANKEIRDNYNLNYNKLKKSILKENIWNEISKIKNDLVKIIETYKEINIENWDRGYNSLIKFLNEEYNEQIKLTPDLICTLYKKTIAGEIGKSQSNDTLFIESIYSYFFDKKLDDSKDYIFFVTNDKKDFYESGKYNNRGIESKKIASRFINENVDIIGLEHIKSLYKYINSYTDINKVISNIHNEHFKEQKVENLDIDDNYENYVWYEDKEAEKSVMEEFEKMDKTIKQLKIKRLEILVEIEMILKKSRELKSWDNRSELKLYQWLEERVESELKVSTISDLLKIKTNLEEYYQIHLNLNL